MTDVAELARRVRSTVQQLDRLSGRAHQVGVSGKAAVAEVERLTRAVDLHAKTAALLTTIGEQAQEDARARFEALATKALQVIFGEGMTFRLVPGESGGQVTLEPVIVSESGGVPVETGVLDARGGGLAVVVGFVLQLVMILLSPGARKVIFLDETFAFLSRSFTARLGEFIRGVASELGVQVFMITHDETFAEYADRVYRIAPDPDGWAQVFEGEVE